ncbi:hypothetical protein NOCA1240408 [metagenome]|uniref:Uncharacterized protein n=1 Tax=metagenome TaxID=256318 RepID=A0A2P2CH13_9ZZZZ
MMDQPTTTPSARARTNGPAARTGRWLTTHPVLGYVVPAWGRVAHPPLRTGRVGAPAPSPGRHGPDTCATT